MSGKQADIPGYQDPGTTNASTGNKSYKTFTEGTRSKTFGSTAVGNPYSKYGEDTTNEGSFCPVCKNSAIETCPCIHNDKKCSAGHIWYTARDGKILVGNPHKN